LNYTSFGTTLVGPYYCIAKKGCIHSNKRSWKLEIKWKEEDPLDGIQRTLTSPKQALPTGKT